MNIRQLRNLVLETISEERRRPSKRKQKTIKEKRDDSELELQSLIKEHPIYKKAEMEFDKVEIISIEEVPKLSIVSNENNDKVKDK